MTGLTTGPETLRAWRLELPFRTPLSLNDRTNRYVRARQIKLWRQAAWLLAKEQHIPPLGRISVTLTYIPAVNRRRDGHNLHATLKPLVDGIVSAGVVCDDTDAYVVVERPVIAPKGPPGPHGGRIFLDIDELPEVPEMRATDDDNERGA